MIKSCRLRALGPTLAVLVSIALLASCGSATDSTRGGEDRAATATGARTQTPESAPTELPTAATEPAVVDPLAVLRGTDWAAQKFDQMDGEAGTFTFVSRAAEDRTLTFLGASYNVVNGAPRALVAVLDPSFGADANTRTVLLYLYTTDAAGVVQPVAEGYLGQIWGDSEATTRRILHATIEETESGAMAWINGEKGGVQGQYQRSHLKVTDESPTQVKWLEEVFTGDILQGNPPTGPNVITLNGGLDPLAPLPDVASPVTY